MPHQNITQSAGFLETHYTALEVEATVLWDNRRKFKVANLDQASLGIVFNVHMESDEPQEKLIELLKHAEDGCYASDVVQDETPFRAHLIVNGDEMYVHKYGAETPDLPQAPAFGDNPTGISKEEIAAKKARWRLVMPDLEFGAYLKVKENAMTVILPIREQLDDAVIAIADHPPDSCCQIGFHVVPVSCSDLPADRFNKIGMIDELEVTAENGLLPTDKVNITLGFDKETGTLVAYIN